jgi:polyhydroxyalkanoate synthesis repressor PhaR
MSDKPRVLQIKKYPNRRFYDATRSRHVTLPELHELICAGHEIVVHDARSGADITNLVLTQIILERDADKLSFFPPNILHQVIRTQQQLLGGVVEQYFRQTLDAFRTSQERWAAFLRNTLGAGAAAGAADSASFNPFDWTSAWMKSFIPAAPPTESPRPTPAAAPPAESEVAELRRQLAELTRRIARVAGEE